VRRCNYHGAAAIVAVTDDRRLVLIEQFRVPGVEFKIYAGLHLASRWLEQPG